MKQPVLMFVLGAVLASGIAVLLVSHKNTSEPAVTTAVTPAPVAPAVETPTPSVDKPSAFDAPEHETHPTRTARERDTKPVKNTRSTRSNAQSKETIASSTTTTSSPAPSQPAASQSTTSTSVSAQGGPPQTTISMPPPPDGRSAPETKPAPPARVPKTVTIPAGTLLSVRIDDHLSSSTTHSGDSFRATLEQPVVVDSAVIAERGAKVEGRVSESDAGGKVRGLATLQLELVRLNTSDGQRVRLQTEGFTKQAQKSTKKDAAKIGIGAGLGAAIGAIAGGGKGAAIGAGVGGAAGTGAVMATRGEAAEVPAETRMTFRLREPITITEKLDD